MRSFFPVYVLVAFMAMLRGSESFQVGLPSTATICNLASKSHEKCMHARVSVSSGIFRGRAFPLHSTASDKTQSDIDVDALLKYSVAGVAQMAGFALVLLALDKGVEAAGIHPPLWASGLFFYACSLRSRILNPLSNERPKVGSPISEEIARPSWFPPGVIFPIMWILIIGPIRAYSSALVYDAAGEFMNLATLSFLLHLTCGDIWNTINNVEKRLGAAASGVALVILSAANASYQYYQVDATAGELLGLTLIWLCTAGALVTSIWQLNPDPTTQQKDSLFPVKGDVQTRFAWFSNNE